MNTTELLNEREKTHGGFVSGAETISYLNNSELGKKIYQLADLELSKLLEEAKK